MTTTVLAYEEQLNRDPRWAMSEGSRHFDEESGVFKALVRFATRLRELEIDYAVVGGMALFRHGLRRFTEDVDILVRREDLKAIHQQLTGLGYLPPFKNSKQLRDTALGVRIEFLTTGDFPGDGKPKPIAFPDPKAVRIEHEGISYITLPKLIELKLASGMSNPARLKDLADVLELIKILALPAEYANQLDGYVQAKFRELHSQSHRRYVLRWTGTVLAADVTSLSGLKERLQAEAARLAAMLADGVTLEALGDSSEVLLVTTDAAVAAKHGLQDEFDSWGQDH